MHTVSKLGYVLVCTCGWRYEAITHREARRIRQHHYDELCTKPSERESTGGIVPPYITDKIAGHEGDQP
jgi:hypothetical protein